MEFLAHFNFFFRFCDEINIQKSVNLTMMELRFFQTGEFEILAGESISMSSFTHLYQFVLQKSDALIDLAS